LSSLVVMGDHMEARGTHAVQIPPLS